MWDCLYLNENIQKQHFCEFFLIKYDNFSGKLTRIVHFCAKMCKKKHAFSTCFELMTQCLTTNEYDPSLKCALCSIARQVEHDHSLAILDSSNSNLCCFELCGQPNPQGIDPRPGSWGEKKVLGSAGKHVFGEFRGILQEKCLSSTNSRSNRSNC